MDSRYEEVVLKGGKYNAVLKEMNGTILDHLIEGLTILRKYAPNDVMVAEVGNCLSVWIYDGISPIKVTDIEKVRLNEIGWEVMFEDEGWLYRLSG